MFSSGTEELLIANCTFRDNYGPGSLQLREQEDSVGVIAVVSDVGHTLTVENCSFLNQSTGVQGV